MEDVDKILESMRSVSTNKEKGNYGEEACIAALKPYLRLRHGRLLHSLKYPVATNRQGVEYGGNLKLVDGKLYVEPHGGHDEIDLVLITDRRVFLIEVKSYGKAKLLITDSWFFRNGAPYEKDLANQTEKHCRHFYHTFYEYLPDGKPKYIIPVFVSVDKSVIINKSTDNIVFTTLNMLSAAISKYDRYAENSIDVNALMQAIDSKAISYTER